MAVCGGFRCAMVAPRRRLPTRRPPSLRWSASAAAEPAWARRRCPSSSGCAVHGAACGVAQVHTVRCVPARARGLGTACARGGGVAFFRAAIEGQPLFRSFVISTGGSFQSIESIGETGSRKQQSENPERGLQSLPLQVPAGVEGLLARSGGAIRALTRVAEGAELYLVE